MTAVVVPIDALREQRVARFGERDLKPESPGRIVARFATAAQVADDPHGVVVIAVGDRTITGRVFIARRERDRVRIALESGDVFSLRPEHALLRLPRPLVR